MLNVGEQSMLLAESLARDLRQSILQDRSLSGICRAMATWLMLTERLYAPLAQSFPDKQLDCAKGCSVCCKSLVNVRPIEAIFVAVHAQNSLPKEKLARVYGNLADNPHHCPLLIDDLCSVYEARPHICRAYYSSNVKSCEAGFSCDRDRPMQTPSRHDFFFLQSCRSGDVVSRMLQKIGLQSDLVHLQTALLQIFTTPDVIDHWLEGEAVFTLPAAQEKTAVG